MQPPVHASSRAWTEDGALDDRSSTRMAPACRAQPSRLRSPHIIVAEKGVGGAAKPLMVPMGAENAPFCRRIARQSLGSARRNSLIAIPVVPSNNQPSRRHEVTNE